jgi:ribose transport system permease protein
MDEPQSTAKSSRGGVRYGEYFGLVAVLAALIGSFSFTTGHFFSLTTFTSIANQSPDAILIAVGMTYVLIVAGIDLSVGSVLALSAAVLGACVMKLHWPVAIAVPACLLVGVACGILNGLTIVRWSLPAFIVTLGMLEIARGATFMVSNSSTIYIGAAVERLAEAKIFGLRAIFYLAVAIVIAGQSVLTRTVFGRYMIAIGTNEEAVRLSGINTRKIKVAVYVISGFLAALGAVCNVSILGSANPNTGTGAELSAIAAVVIGGTSLMGGRGSVVSSLFGVMIIAVLEAGLAQMGAQEPPKRIVTGCVIIGAVVLDYYRTRLKKGRK